jgi:hypothetical protein
MGNFKICSSRSQVLGFPVPGMSGHDIGGVILYHYAQCNHPAPLRKSGSGSMNTRSGARENVLPGIIIQLFNLIK